MNLEYKSIKYFSEEELKELFLSVNWSSADYPEKLAIAIRNYHNVFTAWDEDKLVGLVSCMDDGIMTAYIHYLLVNKDYQGRGIGRQLVNMVKRNYKNYLKIVLVSQNNKIKFYEDCGFEVGKEQVPMFITSMS